MYEKHSKVIFFILTNENHLISIRHNEKGSKVSNREKLTLDNLKLWQVLSEYVSKHLDNEDLGVLKNTDFFYSSSTRSNIV